jgi:hypothetical protein
MAINVGGLIVNGVDVVKAQEESHTKEIVLSEKPMPEHTVMINGKPKRFHKKMSQYMIDMLTTEEE